jgi:hypothetical protein
MKAAAAGINKPCALPYTVDRIIRRRKKEGGKIYATRNIYVYKAKGKERRCLKTGTLPFSGNTGIATGR